MPVLHTIKAWLYDNPLTENPNDFTARVSSERTLTVKEICESAADRGGADISASAMEHAVSLFNKEAGYRLCDGFSVNAGLYTASVHVKGVFDSPTETFDPAKHTILVEFHQGAELRRELANVQVDVQGKAESTFFIAQVVDVRTGSVNDQLTPSRNAKIAGSKLKIAGEHEDCGVYFVDTIYQTRTKVEAADIVENLNSHLLVVTPPLSAGTYRVEVTTQYSNGSNLLKEPRTAVFDRILTVV
ncbi:hypothetical protein FACS189487_00480 [Campylobacterota bacterium]|nr:hypothetical protein FACS189487_00480 [Campylobacterota bacterium]